MDRMDAPHLLYSGLGLWSKDCCTAAGEAMKLQMSAA